MNPNWFNEFFTQQCTTIENGRNLPNDGVFETTERILSFSIFKDEITKIIKSLGPNKAHGHDGISIRMLKLCTSSISKPLFLLFKHSLTYQWKCQFTKKAIRSWFKIIDPYHYYPFAGKSLRNYHTVHKFLCNTIVYQYLFVHLFVEAGVQFYCCCYCKAL